MTLAVAELQMPVAGHGKAGRKGAAANRSWAIGDQQILQRPLLALFTTTRCPGDVILRLYDAVRSLRDAGIPVISGFHTPMEKECLDLLLRGTQPVVICPARSLHRMRIPAAWKPAILAGRLLLVSPFAERHRRNTAELAAMRNRFVAEIASEIFVAHAPPGSKTVALCRDLLAQGRHICTFDLPTNAGLVALGAQPVAPEAMLRTFSDGRPSACKPPDG
jgi:predicted Rossmann fold nucleotide-binding protein DprA/Smf involved in DNA uptake